MDDLLEAAFSYYNNYYNNLEYIKTVKSGKEAEVHLLKDDVKLMALKIYKQNTKYSSRYEYIPISRVGDKRLQRAVKNRSRKGIAATQSVWTAREFNIMQEAGYYSKNIPKVFMKTDTSLLMEYLGTNETPAPRLIDTNLTLEEAKYAFEVILQNIRLFLQLGFVHGDLSEYNILWFNCEVFIIDFPQVLFINENRNAFEKFSKDLENIENFFRRKYKLRASARTSELKDLFFNQI